MNEIEKLNLNSLDIKTTKLEELKKLFPDLFVEGKLNTEALQRELGEWIEPEKERYGLGWTGKSSCMRVIQQPSTGALLPMKEDSVNFNETQNLIIEGDNLEVLKLLQRSYYGKVKLIYIDPPYNTGKEFIYPDNFQEGLQEYLKRTKQVDGNGFKITTNSDTGGRYHTNWLNMMYPRLYLARNLLKDDGVIFISIDDHELPNLLKICDEIFGEENFVANIVWARKRGKDNSAKFLSRNHEYLVAFAKNISLLSFNRLEMPDQTRSAYKNPDNDPRGDYRALGIWARGSQGGSKYSYTTKSGIFLSEREWLVGEKTMLELDEQEKLIINGDKVYRKMFISEYKGDIPETIWDDASNAANASDEIKALFGYQAFDTAKPIPYISKILKITTAKDDIVLDFFAGSGTTAHAVMEVNAEDGGERKFILVQLPEAIEDKNYSTISELTRHRVIKSIEKQTESLFNNEASRSLGFKAFRLDSSNFQTWDVSGGDISSLSNSLNLFRENVKQDRSSEDILYEILLKSGFELTRTIERQIIAEKEVFSIEGGALLICLEKELSIELIEGMLELSPFQIICLDEGFKGNDQLKVNVIQTIKSRQENEDTKTVFKVV